MIEVYFEFEDEWAMEGIRPRDEGSRLPGKIVGDPDPALPYRITKMEGYVSRRVPMAHLNRLGASYHLSLHVEGEPRTGWHIPRSNESQKPVFTSPLVLPAGAVPGLVLVLTLDEHDPQELTDYGALLNLMGFTLELEPYDRVVEQLGQGWEDDPFDLGGGALQ